MIRWWNDPKYSKEDHLAILYILEDKFVHTGLRHPMYTFSRPSSSWVKGPIIGPNEMSRWENDDAT